MGHGRPVSLSCLCGPLPQFSPVSVLTRTLFPVYSTPTSTEVVAEVLRPVWALLLTSKVAITPHPHFHHLHHRPSSPSGMAVSISKGDQGNYSARLTGPPHLRPTWSPWRSDSVLSGARWRTNVPCLRGPLFSLCPQGPPWPTDGGFRQIVRGHGSVSSNSTAAFSWLWETRN